MLVGDDKMKTNENLENSYYALTSDGMKNKKRIKILKVQYWKGRETNHAATLENIKEFLAQVPKDEKIVIYADEDYIDDKTSFYGQLHSAYTPLYTAGAITVDAIVDENNDIIWNKYEGSKYVVNVDDYKMAKSGKIEDEQNKLKLEILKLTSKAFKMMANSPIQKRTISEIETLKEKLKNLGGKFENGGDIIDLKY